MLGKENDVVVDTAGIDTITSTITRSLAGYAGIENLTLVGGDAINGTGNSGANVITGNDAANVLEGAGGADLLIGGAGSDTYITDGGDTIVEAVDEGIDTVRSSVSLVLSENLENLVLTGSAADGTGNSLANTITCNGGANRLDGGAGDDVLDGAGGKDTLIGGAGNDTFITDGGDQIVEAASGGTDTVLSSVSLTLGANLENLVLTGSAAKGTGNSLANVITGNNAANVLNGGGGADKLEGRGGNDTYITDGGDTIVEAANGGTDTVYSSVSVTVALGANLENLILTGSALKGTGNSLANVITGNSGANTLLGGAGDDTLNGGLGKDTLTGGSGKDLFIFNTKLSSANIDLITDFSVRDDTIRLENAVFTALTKTGALASSAFAANKTGLATDKYDRIIYETDTGKLFYDADGNGKGAAVQFATLTKGLGLTSADFFII